MNSPSMPHVLAQVHHVISGGGVSAQRLVKQRRHVLAHHLRSGFALARRVLLAVVGVVKQLLLLASHHRSTHDGSRIGLDKLLSGGDLGLVRRGVKGLLHRGGGSFKLSEYFAPGNRTTFDGQLAELYKSSKKERLTSDGRID